MGVSATSSGVVLYGLGFGVNRPGPDGGSQSWGRMMRVMAAPRKYSEELQQRATRMALDARISSRARKTAIPNLAAYSAAKFAMLGLTQAMAGELGRFGITVNAVCPGSI